jgi:hypothetical protein
MLNNDTLPNLGGRMSFNQKPSRLYGLAAFIIAALLLTALPAQAQFYDLEVRVGDTTSTPGQLNSVISVYMKNYVETVAGFELLLQLDHSNICEFQTQIVTLYDTSYWNCLEYSGLDCIDSLEVTDSVLLDPEYVYEWFIETITPDVEVGSHD